MKSNSIKTEEFSLTGLSLIHQSGEILTLVRYPFRAGDKDFFLINSDQGFKELIDSRKPKDSVTIFTRFEILKEGLVTWDFINDTLTQLTLTKLTDWLVIISRQEAHQADTWTYAVSGELRDVLRDNLGRYVKILEEPDWLDESKVIHGYTPDEDGQIRPGTY